MTDAISKAPGAIKLADHGRLFVVATPIGNLGDITHRALQTLADVDCILAEDTRHSKRLLNHYGISRKLRSCHEYNEAGLVEWVKSQLQQGTNLALISDAGTPLISDPGFVLVRELLAAGFVVITVPGASAVTAALSVSGLPTDRFIFDGFLPAKHAARRTALTRYLNEPRTVVLLESSHRIEASLQDLVDVLGADRFVVLARELTKRFETVLRGAARAVLQQLHADPDQTRGEFVMMLAGTDQLEDQAARDVSVNAMLSALLDDLPLKRAVAIVSQLTGRRKNDVYQAALVLKNESNQ